MKMKALICALVVGVSGLALNSAIAKEGHGEHKKGSLLV